MNIIDFRLIRQLWMFLVVAEEEHFGRAAKRIGISQPPLSEQIKVLEHSLKLQLFERSRRGTKLSPAGTAILPAVRQFVIQTEALERAVREVASGQSGVLKIGAITSAMLETLPPILTKLKTLQPKLTVLVSEIDSVEAIPLLETGELDLAFVRLDGKISKHISTMPLAEDQLAVALHIDHPLANKRKIALSSLEGESLVMSSRQVSPVYFDMLTAQCRLHGLTPRILHEVRSVTSQIAYVSCGQGVALVPSSVIKLVPDNVVILPLSQNISVVTAAAAWKMDRHHPIVELAVSIMKA